MKILAKILKVLGFTWLILAAILILLGIIGTWRTGGFAAVQELLSPFNIVNWLVTALTLAPGLIILMLSEKAEQRAFQTSKRA